MNRYTILAVAVLMLAFRVLALPVDKKLVAEKERVDDLMRHPNKEIYVRNMRSEGEVVPEEQKLLVLVEILKVPAEKNVVIAVRRLRLAEGTSTETTTEADIKKTTPEADIKETTTEADIKKTTPEADIKETTTEADIKETTISIKREAPHYDVYDDKVEQEDDDDEDLDVAETIIFRPLFTYRQDSAARRRSSRGVSRSYPIYDYD